MCMHVAALECVECGERYPAEEVRYRCDACGSELDVAYDYGEVEGAVSWNRFRERPFDHFRYREFLPVVEEGHMMAMGGGGTPVVEARTLGDELGIDLHFKMESQNPTGSFKDRGTSVELGKAMDHDADEVVVASTGNMGASIAAYAARAGVDARIYIPAATGGPKRRQMEAHGADLVEVDGDYTAAAEQAWREWEDRGVYLMGDYPYRGEGQKTVGYEIMDRLGSADVVAVPVGNGTLLHAVWKAFRELERVGMTGRSPRMLGVQAAGCNTVVKALGKGGAVEAVDAADTVAGAIACRDPLDGEAALDALQESDGLGSAVADEEILEAKRLLAEREGIYAEEAGAAALAGIIDRKDELQGERVVCVVTGHGLKT